MEVIYEILYKNGKEDTGSMRVDQEDKDAIENIKNIIGTCFQEDTPGYINFDGMFIRISDVSRVKITTQENNHENHSQR